MVIDRLKHILANDTRLREKLVRTIDKAAADNPDPQTNPVRTLDDLYKWLERFLTVMPWEGLTSGKQRAKTASLAEQRLFRRIDQSIGYQYFLFGDVQYEPKIAEWLKQYNTAWAEHLNSSESWNDEYLELLKSDPLFELNTDKYESPANWHCWNEFFSRRLSKEGFLALTSRNEDSDRVAFVADGVKYPWLPIRNNTLNVKTATIENLTDLLGDSPYKKQFENGRFMHIALDMFNYHRFHSPCSGTVVDIREIDGVLSDGGRIIWDAAEHRYRYEQQDNIGYQMAEKRAVIVIEMKDERRKTEVESRKTKDLIAIIPVGVAQVGSIRLNEDIKIGATVKQGQELGCFLCGGSDVIVLFA